MRLLLFSDLHLDTHFRWAGPALARARRLALRETLQSITALARAQQADALLCAGDLYEHERFSPDTAHFLRDAFESVDMPVFLAPGNHDWYGPQSLYHQVEWTPNVHLFTEDRFVAHELADGLTLWGAAHRAPANTDGFVEHFRVDRGGVNLALFHGSETATIGFQESGKLPHAPFTASEIEAAGIDHAFVGHFHTARDAERHTYPGNPDPLAFGESAGRGVVLFTVHDDGTVERERHDVSVSEVHDVTVRLDGVSHSGQVREQVIAAVAGLSGVARVTITGEIAPEVDLRPADLATLAPHLDALVPRLGPVHVAYDFDALAGEPTVRGQFVRNVREDPTLDEETRRRVLVTGLRALDGRASELAVH
ncbi:metallophosphoesterase [Actinosynnema sp. NPDC002837]